MVSQKGLVAELQSVVGTEHVRPGAAGDAVDGVLPGAAVQPGTYEEVAAVMRYADAEGLAVVPRGGGTMMGLGNLPHRHDIALNLSRLDGVVEHEPADLTATVRAGMTLGALRERLARTGQSVPFDPTLPGEATVGGVLAADASGPWRHSQGTARDFTIGMRVVTAEGRLTRAGGRVVKNVAGYDMCKLYIGSLGTLGVVVEATFKLAPLPKAQGALALAFEGARQACAAAAEMHGLGLSAGAVQLFKRQAAAGVGSVNEPSCRLSLQFAGSSQAVARSLDEARRAAAAHGGREAEAGATDGPEGLLFPPDEGALHFRLGTVPARVPSLLAALEGALPRAAVVAYPTCGIVRIAAVVGEPRAAVASVQRTAAEAGGWAVVEACPPELKREIDVFGEPPQSFELMRRLKAEFDSRGTLSPGRFVGRL